MGIRSHNGLDQPKFLQLMDFAQAPRHDGSLITQTADHVSNKASKQALAEWEKLNTLESISAIQ